MDDSNKSRPLTFILKRHSPGANARYSFEAFESSSNSSSKAKANDGATGNVKLWAQLKRGLNGANMYIISTDVNDFGKARKDRNPATFRGKLVAIERHLVYQGYRQPVENDDKIPLVSILYDHQRASKTDHKMEVAIPLVPMAPITKDSSNQNNVSPTKALSAPAFHPLFMKIRREGWENLPPQEGADRVETHNDKVLVLMQACDDKNIMSSAVSLSAGGVDPYAVAAAGPGAIAAPSATAVGQSSVASVRSEGESDVAAMISTKNFALILRPPSRPWSNVAPPPPPPAEESAAAAAAPAPASIFTKMVTTAATTAAAAAPPPTPGANCYMSFGKLRDDVHCCKLQSDKIDITTAFMICLSRFDTLQQY